VAEPSTEGHGSDDRPPRPGVSVLLEHASPNGNVLATVEEQAGVTYLYLHAAEGIELAPRACWVRNLKPAPAEVDTAATKRGDPPLLPASACAHPQGAEPLDQAKLRVVWFEEGDAAALLEGEEVLAVISNVGGDGRFHGYARDCTTQSPFCWPLAGADAVVERVREAETFWRSWEHSPWVGIRDGLRGAYERAFGVRESQYYAIDNNEWPPRAIARYDTPTAVVLVTLGVSVRPQPTVERYIEDPRSLRRIEMGVAVAREFAEADDSVVTNITRYLAAQANLPWERYVWLGNGHAIACEPHPLGEPFAAMLLLKSPSGAPPVQVPAYRGDPVNLLWMVPVTAAERDVAAADGSGTLLSKLAPQFPLWPARQRASVA
jgi:hypothetical protein